MSEILKDDSTPNAVYYPVAISKFIALSVLTGGFYQAYWLYKNWSFIRDRDSSRIWPFWRAVFGVVWYPALMLDFNKNQKDREFGILVIVLLGVLYFFWFRWFNAPGLWFLVGFLSFLPLLPVVSRINASNRRSPQYVMNSSWGPRQLVLVLFSVPLTTYGTALGVGLIPNDQVVPGWKLWRHHRDYLEDIGSMAEDEFILLFYSDGFLSIKDGGSVLTDQGVASYWRDEETGELFVFEATFTEIAKVAPEYGDWIDPTIVTVTRQDGSKFPVFLSTTDDGDRSFFQALNKSVQDAAPDSEVGRPAEEVDALSRPHPQPDH